MADDDTNRLLSLIDPGLDPVFAEASRIGVESAWFGHVPFAHWLVGACRPGLLVELGTHNGASYAAFCDAILANRLPTRAVAIDTWQGDSQAGFYDNTVYEDLKAFHDPRYGTFSTLIRARFDEALNEFADRSTAGRDAPRSDRPHPRPLCIPWRALAARGRRPLVAAAAGECAAGRA